MGPKLGSSKWPLYTSHTYPLDDSLISTLNLMPLCMTQISFGFTINLPNSVVIFKAPFCGTISKSPSEVQKPENNKTKIYLSMYSSDEINVYYIVYRSQYIVYLHLSFMLMLHAQIRIPTPLVDLGSPAPATVLRPSTQSIRASDLLGISNGFQRSYIRRIEIILIFHNQI